MYKNSGYIMPNSSKLKKIKCNQNILVQSWWLILSNSNWKCDVFRPANWSTSNWPITEWIHCDGLISFHNDNDRLRLANPKAKYKLHHQYVECLQYRNSKSSHQKLHFFKCEYLSFYTVYELETLRIYCYSPSLRTGWVLTKIWMLAKNLVRRPLFKSTTLARSPDI